MPVEVLNSGETARVGNGNANASKHPPVEINDNPHLEVGYKQKAESFSEPSVPDGGWGWMVVFGSFVIYVIAGGIMFSFGIFVEDLVDHFESSKSAVGGVGSLMIGSGFLVGPLVSALTNKLGCRVVTIACTLTAFFGLIISSWAPNIWFLYLSFGCIVGAGLSILNVPAIVVLSLYFHEKLSLAVGIAVCGMGVGIFAFAPLVNALLSEYSWKGTFLIEAGILLNCVLCGMIFRPLSEPTSTTEPVVSKTGDLQQRTKSENSARLQLANQTGAAGVHNTSLDHVSRCQIDRDGYVRYTTKDQEPQTTIDKTLLKQKPTNAITVEMPKMVVKSASNPELRQLYRPADTECENSAGSLRSVSQGARPLARTTESFDHIPEVHADCDNVDTTTTRRKQPELQGGLAKDDIMKKTRQTATKTMDFRLLLDVVFILFAVSNFFTGFGYTVPYIFVPNRGRVLGFDTDQSSWLVSMMGIANIIGRVVTGLLANLKFVNKLLFYNTARVIWGIATLISVLLHTYVLQMCYSFVFGFIVGVYFCLTPLIIVDLLGVKKLSNALGFVLLFRGAGVLGGPPFAGWLYDVSDSYDNSFYVTGIFLIISGLMLYSIPCIQRWQLNRNNKKASTDRFTSSSERRNDA